MEKVRSFWEKNRISFTSERIICRLLAAWCCVAAYNLLQDDAFTVLSYGQDQSLVLMALLIGGLFIGMSAANMYMRGGETDSWFLMAGGTVCVIRWLWANGDSAGKLFFALAVTVAYSLFVIYFIRKNEQLWKEWKPGKRTVWAVTIICGVFSGFVIAAVTCYRYLMFYAPNFDFGLFVNMFHNMKETGLPLCTSERDVLLSHFVVHFSPVYYLLLPFYMIFPSALTLQIGQAVIVASGVIPVTLLCRHFKLSGKCTILIAIIYSLYPALSTGCFYDLHENCFLTPLILWMIYFFERGNYLPMYGFAALTCTVKEDAAVYVVLFAIYVLLAKKKYLHGGILLVGALAYFGVVMSVLKSSSAYYAQFYQNDTPNPGINGPMVDRFNNLIYEKDTGLIGALKTALVNPGYLLTQLFTTGDNGWGKVLYFLQLFMPLGFIPFLANKPSRWLLIAPVLMNTLTQYPYQFEIGYQYNFGIAAFLIYAVVINVPELKLPVRRNMLCLAAVACCCLYMIYVIPPLRNNHKAWMTYGGSYIRMEQILDEIPKDASVSCSTFLLAHLADRDEIYEIGYHGYVGDTDYVIFDGRYAVEEAQLNAFLEQGYFVKERHEGLLLILQKK